MSVVPVPLAGSRDSRSGSRSSAGQAFHPAIKTRAGEISGIGSQAARVPIVPRPSLVGRLMLSDEPLVVISAPAGYGKTTLLHQWAAVDERPFAWVGLSGSDNDPARLAEHLEQALLATGALCRRRLVLSTTLERAGTDVRWGVGSHPTEIAAVVPALSPVVIVLDDSQELTDPTATALLETTLDCLPQASRLVFAGRARPRLPLGHLQVQGRVLRMGPEDLSLAPEDGARLIEATGLRVNRRSEAKLLEVTEGWPAGLALAARSLRSGRDPDLDARNFDGSDVAVAEYLDEVLDQLDQASLDFLTETSVLERFSPGLCDAVRQRGGSAAIIKSLERWNVFLVPLDRAGQWYRYHKLFAGYLQARRRHTLGRDDAALHARASRWWEHEGDLDAAARHAYASGDLHRFEEIVWFAAPNFLASDRLPDLAAWLRLPTSEQVASSPPIALAAAWMRSVHDAAETGTLTANLAHTASSSLPDGTPVRAGLALLRATTAERGLSRAIADAASAYDAIENHSPWKAFACLFAGTALRLQGHRDHAEEALHEGYDRAALTMPALAAACLVQLAWVAMDEGEWEQARSYGARGPGLCRVVRTWP